MNSTITVLKEESLTPLPPSSSYVVLYGMALYVYRLVYVYVLYESTRIGV